LLHLARSNQVNQNCWPQPGTTTPNKQQLAKAKAKVMASVIENPQGQGLVLDGSSLVTD